MRWSLVNTFLVVIMDLGSREKRSLDEIVDLSDKQGDLIMVNQN
jgi:hypothetical protein